LLFLLSGYSQLDADRERPVHPTRKKLDAPGRNLCFNVLGPNEQDCGQPETGDD
jgi:hypothetical protein